MNSGHNRDLSRHHVALVTSVINVAQTQLSCKNFRSRYTPQERLDQTIETCVSVRNKIPDCIIIVIEGSIICDLVKSRLQSVCDVIHLVSSDTRRRVESPIKAHGEVSLLLDFLESQEFTRIQALNKEILTISKISGRYTLTNKFDFGRFPASKLVVHAEHGHGGWINTRYYRVPVNILAAYISDLRTVQSLSERNEVALEQVQFKTLPIDLFYFVRHQRGEYIGVQGIIAIREWVEHVEDFTT